MSFQAKAIYIHMKLKLKNNFMIKEILKIVNSGLIFDLLNYLLRYKIFCIFIFREDFNHLFTFLSTHQQYTPQPLQ